MALAKQKIDEIDDTIINLGILKQKYIPHSIPSSSLTDINTIVNP